MKQINKFSPETIEEIKSYVYLYSDPDTEEVFYIGKGQGNRCFNHLEEKTESRKVERIQQLKAQGKQPSIELLRYGLTEKETSMIEATLIDFIGVENLTNKVRGLRSSSFGKVLVDDIALKKVRDLPSKSLGRVSIDDIALKYSAKKVKIDDGDDVILITINKLYHSKMSAEELYEATRGVWVIGDRKAKVKYAFALFQGVVREVYQIDKWHKAGTWKYKYREIDNNEYPNRWEFEGKVADSQIRARYLKKSVRQYLIRQQNPIRYVNC